MRSVSDPMFFEGVKILLSFALLVWGTLEVARFLDQGIGGKKKGN